MWEHPLQDLVAIAMPYIIPPAVMMIGACILYDPTLEMLVHNAVPARCQNWFAFWLCFLEEMRIMILCGGIAVPVWQCQIGALALMNKKLQDIAKVTDIRY